MARLKVFYVYMHNATDRDDDEVFKVKAIDAKDAKEVAVKCMAWPNRSYTGDVFPARPSSEAQKRRLRQLKWWASDKTLQSNLLHKAERLASR